MTVAQLIAELRDMPEDAIVVQRGYESGMDDVRSTRCQKIYLRKPPAGDSDIQWWDGTYQSYPYYYDGSEEEFTAVILGQASG